MPWLFGRVKSWLTMWQTIIIIASFSSNSIWVSFALLLSSLEGARLRPPNALVVPLLMAIGGSWHYWYLTLVRGATSCRISSELAQYFYMKDCRIVCFGSFQRQYFLESSKKSQEPSEKTQKPQNARLGGALPNTDCHWSRQAPRGLGMIFLV